MKNKNIFMLFGLFVLLLIAPFVSATCDYTAKTDGGSDYFGVTGTTVNVTAIPDNQSFTHYTAFTPRLNFTVPINSTFVAGIASSVNTLSWKTPLNVSSSFAIYNGSTLIDPSNYTLKQTGSTKTVNWTTSEFNGTTLTYVFNRTFIKNVEDLITTPTDIYTGATTANFVTLTEGSGYGTDSSFKMNNNSLGQYITGKNWAVTWSYTEKNCYDQGCSNPVNSTLLNVLATIFILGMLVFIAYSLMNGANGTVIIGAVVAFVIMLIALAILNGIVSSICAV